MRLFFTALACLISASVFGQCIGNCNNGKGAKTYRNGNKYEGEWQANQWNGSGTFTWSNGDVYKGGFEQGAKHGHGTMDWVNGDKYVGEWKINKRNGNGTKSWSSDDRCVAVSSGVNWQDFKRLMLDSDISDKDLIIRVLEMYTDKKKRAEEIITIAETYSKIYDDIIPSALRISYEGQWKDNKPQGQGTLVFLSGNKYVGEFKKGKRHGQAAFNWVNGDKHLGEWMDGEKNGHGTFNWVNGDKYVGEFKKGKRHGQGAFNGVNGDKYLGEYMDGKKNGHGTFNGVNGVKYIGEWKDGKKNGLGTYTGANGDKYVGEFKGGRHGIGIQFNSKNAKVYAGEWKEDKKNGTSRFETHPSPSLKNMDGFIKNYVEEQINKWQEKGEFETTFLFQARVNTKSRKEKIIFIHNEALNLFKFLAMEHFLSSKDHNNFAMLNTYDADNETFLISFLLTDFNPVVLKVPIDQAKEFKDDFEVSNLNLFDLELNPNKFMIKHLQYFNNVHSSNVYEYIFSEDYKYISTSIDYDFDEIDLNDHGASNTNNIVTGTQIITSISSGVEITFQSSDLIYNISTIAVIPKEIQACDGNVKSADELAVYTENSILSCYNVVDREDLDEILQEHKLQASGLTIEKNLLELGSIVNAQAYLFVQSVCLQGNEMIVVKLIDCETMAIVWSCTGVNASPKEVLDRIKEELSN